MSKIGYLSQVTLIPLSKAEIVRRGLPLRWHGEFQTDLKVESVFTGPFTIPAGFLTDDATIPKLAWNILSNTDPNISYPAFGHDFLYSIHGMLPNRQITKDQADQFLREQMKAIGAPQWQYDQVYWAVRMFGGGYFRARIVGMKQAWNDMTPAPKLYNTPYSRNIACRLAQ